MSQVREHETELAVDAPGAPPKRLGLQALAAAYAVIGGVLAAVMLFATPLALWGLLVGIGVTVALGLATSRGSGNPEALGLMAAYSLAFTVLSWPVLLVIASGIWGEWE